MKEQYLPQTLYGAIEEEFKVYNTQHPDYTITRRCATNFCTLNEFTDEIDKIYFGWDTQLHAKEDDFKIVF